MTREAFGKTSESPRELNISSDNDGSVRLHFPVSGRNREDERQRGGPIVLSSSGIPTVAGVSLLSLLLAACNGGGGGGSGGGGGGLSGVVADGYLANMKVYRIGNPSAYVMTDASGHFTGLSGTGDIVAEPTSASVDISTTLAFLAKLTAPEGASVINPLTTVLQAAIAQGSTAADVKAKLGIGAGVDLLTYDPIAANDVKTQAVAAQIANVLASAAKNGVTTNVASAIAAEIKAGHTVDLSSATFLQTVGITDSRLAQALAASNATSAETLAGIAAMQKLVQNLSTPASDAALNTFLTNVAEAAHTYDTTAPEAPTHITVTTVGGTLVDDTLNATNTNLKAHATIGAGQATGGKAELLLDGVAIAADTTIAATDTSVDFDLGTTTAALLRAAVTHGGVLTVKLTDSAGNATVSSETKTLTVDYAAPDAPTIALSDAIGDGATAAEAQATGAFKVTGEANAWIAVVFNGQSDHVSKFMTGTGSAQNVDLSAEDLETLGDGAVTVTATQTDAAGNQQTVSTNTASFTLDTLAPSLTITADKTAVKAGETATLTFTFSEAPTGFTEADVSAVAGTISGLAQSSDAKVYTALFTPSAGKEDVASIWLSGAFTDAAGNANAAADALELAIDTQAPDAPTAITVTAVGGTLVDDTLNSTNTNLTAQAAIGAGQATGGKAELLLDGYVIATDTSIAAADTGVDFDLGKTTAESLQTAVAQGGVLSVRLTDKAGNATTSEAGEAKTLTVDYVAPTVTAVALSGATGNSGVYLNAGDVATVSVTLSDDVVVTGTPTITLVIGATDVSATYDASASTATVLKFNYTIVAGRNDVDGIAAKANSLTGVIADVNGNPLSLTTILGATDNANYLVDTAAPGAPVLSLTGLENGATSAEATGSGAIKVSGESGASIDVTFTGQSGHFTKSVTGTGSAQAVGLSAQELQTLGDGVVTVTASQTDAAGNAQSGSGSPVTFTLDTDAPNAPTVTLTGLANGATAEEATATGAITVTGETGASIDVTFTGLSGHFTRSVTGTGGAQNVALDSDDLATLGDGAVTVSVSQTDAAGNQQTAAANSSSFTLDTQAPTITITSAAGDGVVDASEIQNGFDISGTAAGVENGQQVSVQLAYLQPISATVTNGAWTAHVSSSDASALGATAPLSASVSDAAGNSGSTTFTGGLSVAVTSDGLDGYISNAQFFIDEDEDLALDVGEYVTTGDGVGSFSLPASGPIVMRGGVDISTGFDFTSMYEAPTAYRVINPVTTLVMEAVRLPGNTTGAAEEDVKTLLGAGGASVTLATFNPFKAALSIDESYHTAAVAYQKLAAELSLVMDVGSSVLASLTGYASAADGLALTQTLSVKIVSAIASNVNAVGELTANYIGNLSSAVFLESILKAADNTSNTSNGARYDAAVTATAQQIALANSQIAGLTATGATSQETINLLTSIAKVQVVAKGELTDALVAYATDSSATTPPDYTATIASKVSAAVVGVIIPAQVSGALASGTTSRELEGSASSGAVFEVELTRGGDTTVATEVSYEVLLGSNITANVFGGALPSGVVTFAAGQSAATIKLTTLGDSVAQGAKTFVLKVSDPNGTVKFVDGAGDPVQTLNFGFTIANDDAPALTAPAAIDLQPGVASRITDLSISYPDAFATVGVTVSAAEGAALGAAPSDAALYGAGTSLLTIYGTVSQVNSALATLSANIPNSASGGLTVTTTANGVTSAPVDLSVVKHYASTITTPETNAVIAGTITNVHGFAVADSDSSDITVQLTANGGRIYGFGAADVSRSVASNGVVTISGSMIEVNKALDGLTVASIGESFSLTLKAIDGDSVTQDPVAVWTTTAAPAPTTLTLPGAVSVQPGQASLVQGVQVGDADSNFVTVTLSPNHGSLAFGASAAAIQTIDGVTTLSGSLASVNDALAAMTFKAVAGATAASIAIVADDGDARSTAASRTLTLALPAEGAPLAGGNLTSGAITEDTPTQLSISGFTLSDPNGATPTSVRILSVTGGVLTNPDGTAITLGAEGSVVQLVGGALNVKLTPDANREYMSSFTYAVVDAETGANSLPGTVSTPITGVNDAPVLQLNANAAAYVEKAGQLLLAPGVSLADVDSALLSGATVTIGSGLSADDVLSAGALPSGVTASFANGVLTLTGQASLPAYQAALRAVSFSNASADPSTASRAISFSVTDKEGATSAAGGLTLKVTAVNDAPTLTTPTGALQATEQTTLSLAGKGITIGDVDLGTGQASVVLDVVSGTLSATAANVAVTPSADGHTLTLQGSLSALNALLSGAAGTLSYVNASDNPLASDRLSVSVIDNGGLSSTKTVTIGITPVNDLVSLDLNGAMQGVNSAALYVAGSTAASVLAPSAILTDPDGPGVVRIQAQISGGSRDVLKLTDAASAAASSAGATVAFDAVNGILTVDAVSGQSLSLAVAKTIVQGVGYLSTDPTATGARSVAFSVFDVVDGAPGTATANVTIASAPYASISSIENVTTLTLKGDPGASAIVADLAQHRLTGDGASLQVKTTGASLFAVNGVDARDSDKAVRILGDQGMNGLAGSRYDDVITGGLGRDLLIGAGGRDTFVFGELDTGSTTATADVVADFTSSDVIRLPAGLVFNAAATTGAVKDAWVESNGGRAYVVFETDVTGIEESLRYIDIGPVSVAQRAFFYDAASGDLTMKSSLMITSDVNTLKVGGTATIRFTFSDAPTGFTVDDLNVTGGVLGAIQSTDNPNVLTAVFTPDASNSLAAAISLKADFKDASGNAFATDAVALTGDTLAPSLTITADKTGLKAGETANVTFTFSETPADFAAGDLAVTGGAIGAVTQTTNPKVYTGVFTPTAGTEIDASISLTGDYRDAAGNIGGSTGALSLAVDTLAPSLTITADKTVLKAGETATVTFTFTEAPTGFATTDLTVTGGAISGLTQTENLKVFTATFTPDATDTLAASVSLSGAFTDRAGNSGASTNALSLTGDTLAPTMTITSDKSALKTGDTATVTFTFTETPTDFAATDLTVTGGAIGAVTQTANPNVYTALFTPTAGTEIDASISLTGAYTDAANNTNASSSPLHLAVDTLAPSLTIIADRTELKAGQTTTVSFMFTEATTGLEASDLIVSGGELGTIHTTNDAKVLQATFTPNVTNALDASIAFSPSGSFADAAGNAGASTASVSLTGDTLAPSLAITSDKSVLKAGETATVTFTFTETPTGFAATDLTVTGGALGAIQSTSDPKVFTATFTPNVTNALDASIAFSPSGSFADTAGNAGASAASVSLTGDTLAPTMTITAAKTALNTGESILVTFAFTEAPVGFGAGDVNVAGGTLGALDTTNASAITALFTPTGTTGTASISVTGGYADAAGNAGGGASLALSANLAPTLTIVTSAQTIDEDGNNTGRVVAANNKGVGVYPGSDGTANSITLADADNTNYSGGYLNAHIINRVAISGVGGDRLGLSGGRQQFTIDADGTVWFRQETLVSGKNGFLSNGVTYAAGDPVVVDANSADNVLVGTLATIDGVLQDGKHGADLRIDLNASATKDIVQLLAANVSFGVRLYNGDTTQAWENFLPASGVQQSVQFTLDDGKGGVASASRVVSVTAQNDAPTPVNDSSHVDATATAAVTGNVLTNDVDPDNLGGAVAPVQTLTVTKAAGVDVSANPTTVQGAHGVLTISANGSYSYQVNAADPAVAGLTSGRQITDEFSYIVTDNGATPLTGTANLVITIDGAAPVQNTNPTATFQDLNFVSTEGGSGSLLAGASDSDAGQSLHVVMGSIAKGTQPATDATDTGAGPVTITGTHGVLTVQASGAFTYAAAAGIPLFSHVSDTFSYIISDGHGGTVDTGLQIYAENLPFRLKATEAGVYNINFDGVTVTRVTVVDNAAAVAWAPSDIPVNTVHSYNVTVTPDTGAGTAELSVDNGDTYEPYLTFRVTTVAALPTGAESPTPDFTIVTGTRAAIVAAATEESPLGTLARAHSVVAVVTDSAEPSDGASEMLGAAGVPIVDYLGLVGLPSTSRTIDEDANNTGRLIAFNGFGSHIYSGSEDNSAVGVSVAHSAANFNGGVLTAHIDNRVGVSGIAGEMLFIKTSSNLFRVDSNGDIYFRQGTLISGSNGFTVNGHTYAASDAVVTDANTADDIKIGSLNVVGGVTQDGKQVRDLSIALTANATPDIVQLLAGQIGFGIRLSNGDGTQAWTRFADVEEQPSVTFTLAHGGSTGSATRLISLVEHNDTPVAHNDLAAIGTGGSFSASGFSVLSNDDPDVLPNQGSGGLPADLVVTDVWTESGGHELPAPAFTSTTLQGAYGSLTLNANGTYSYTVDQSNAAVAGLGAGAFLVDTFHYSMTDGQTPSTADLKIMIDTLTSHWGPENKNADNTTATAETIYRHATSGETQYLFGFGENDKLGAVGDGTVKIDGGNGDDVMYALATNTSLTGGAGADKFVIGNADIHVRIEDMNTVTSNATYNSAFDALDLSRLFSSAAEGNAFLNSHTSEVTDSVTGKTSTKISFDGLGGATHSGDVLIVGMDNSTVQDHVQISVSSLSAVNYSLLDELKLIAAHHG
jgi:VCBS repeat-containing protein